MLVASAKFVTGETPLTEIVGYHPHRIEDIVGGSTDEDNLIPPCSIAQHMIIPADLLHIVFDTDIQEPEQRCIFGVP